MKSTYVVLGAGALGLAALLAGCGDDHRHRPVVIRERPVEHRRVIIEQPRERVVVVEERPRDVIIVKEAPPRARIEVRPAPPSHEHVWIAGYYSYHKDNHKYVWVSGHYVKPPRKGAHWTPDKWERDKDGHHYRPGRWD